MAKISLNKLKLNTNIQPKIVEIDGNKIEVLQYLSTESKANLLDIAIQESLVGNTCDPILLEALFHVYIVLEYTNISLTPTQKENLFKTYDLLESNGILDLIESAIPDNEFAELELALEIKVKKTERELKSFTHVLQQFLNSMPDTFTNLEKTLEGWDSTINSENIKNIMAVAKDNGAL